MTFKKNESTQVILTGIRDSICDEEYYKKVVGSLNKIDLGNNKEVIKIFIAHPDSFNKLSRLFDTLKRNHVSLTSEILSTVESNWSNAGGVADLIDFMKNEAGLSVIQETTLQGLANIYLKNATESFRHGIRQLSKEMNISSDILNLFYARPEESSKLAALILSAKEHACTLEELVSELEKASSIKDFNDLLTLLGYAMEHDIFYPSLVGVLVKQSPYLANVCNGLILLGSGKPDKYLEMTAKNPENAILIAKTILLFRKKNAVDFKILEHLIPSVNQGAFLFLKQLDWAKRLDQDAGALVLRNTALFTQEELIAPLKKNVLFSALDQSQIDKIIAYISNPDHSPELKAGS